jgi:hypothetical protein
MSEHAMPDCFLLAPRTQQGEVVLLARHPDLSRAARDPRLRRCRHALLSRPSSTSPLLRPFRKGV